MDELPGYDKWKTENGEKEEIVVSTCTYCSEEIYEGEPIYVTYDGDVHEECFIEYAKEIAGARHSHA